LFQVPVNFHIIGRSRNGDDGEGRQAPAQNHREPMAMPIHRLLQNHLSDPDTVAVMVTAFEDALRELGLSDRADPATELVARKIIEVAERGERDPARLRDQVVRSLSK
jgi:hypothetical protein